MKLLVTASLALLAAPAFAQTPVDWSKPVVGVDTPPKIAAEEVSLPVQVMTVEQAKAQPSTATRDTPLPPPCEPPPTANKPAQKPPGPNPCPAAR